MKKKKFEYHLTSENKKKKKQNNLSQTTVLISYLWTSTHCFGNIYRSVNLLSVEGSGILLFVMEQGVCRLITGPLFCVMRMTLGQYVELDCCSLFLDRTSADSYPSLIVAHPFSASVMTSPLLFQHLYS